MEPLPPTEDHNAGRRAREVYRFFRSERLAPINEDASSTSDALHSPDPSCQSSTSIGRAPSTSPASSIASRPVSSTASRPSKDDIWAPLEQMPQSLVLGDDNVSLDSFAQLAALRLDVDRVFISVSDRDSQFIIAQAAQTITGNSKYNAMGGGVYTGRSTLDIGSWKMCRDTIAMTSSSRASGEYSFLVSNDLSQDERYRHLPLVTEEPHFRFYAGTPLTTESNINLGCFFVLDTKPRPDFTRAEKETMAHMSMLVMDFLKVSRQATEGRRAARLSQGLSRFVEGNSSLFDAAYSPTADDLAPPSSASVRSGPDSLSVEHLNRHNARRSRSRSTSVRSPSSQSESRGEASVPSSLEPPFPSWPSNHRQKHTDLNKGTSWTFRRAANLIRESLELQGDSGVIFVEAPREPMSDVDSGSDSFGEIGNPATVLAMSTETNPLGLDTTPSPSHSVKNLDEDFLYRLLGRYHKGRLWAFHRDGLLSSSDNEKPRKSRARTRPSGRPTGTKKRKTTENSILNRCFPGATQVLFVPLWNAANSQWFGGCFCWNGVESNVFNPSVELSSLLGFGSSIMAECNRVESLISDRQKADFLGSISHELRSPLHGILAAAELMQSTELNIFQGSLMETIDACGRTLLDTMNQVLDYSKIISLEREFRHLKRRKTSSLDLKQIHRNAAHLDAYMTTDVSVLTEEVVEGVCVGQLHGPGTTTTDKPQSNVDVIIDIAPNNWIYHTPPGALRRIIMNIFSNSIKYTEQGNVSLHLEAKKSLDPHRGQKEDLVTLTVSDTGKGISEEFLRGKLYVPFAQEDSLASGTGLGLSIVRSLVKSLGGSINVFSRPSDGTIVQVALPLMRPGQEDVTFETPPSAPCENFTSETESFREVHQGKKVAIWGVEPEDASNHGYWGATSRYLTDWCDLRLVSPSSEHVDLILANKLPSVDEIGQSPRGISSPLLVLSTDHLGNHLKRVEWSSVSACVSFVSHPCGPRKLARSIQKCLDQAKIMPSDTQSIAVPERPKIPIPAPTENPTKPDLLDTNGDTRATTAPSIPDSKPTSSEPHNPPKNDTSTQSKNPRVLIVEDNKINLNLMLAFLKKRKLTTLDSAENGQIAVDAVKNLQHNYDIIFMDISMPIMNGFEATRAIRMLEKERAVALQPSNIIALTGLSSARDETEALDSGMDLFLTKPVTLKSITKILDEWGEKDSQARSGP